MGGEGVRSALLALDEQLKRIRCTGEGTCRKNLSGCWYDGAEFIGTGRSEDMKMVCENGKEAE